MGGSIISVFFCEELTRMMEDQQLKLGSGDPSIPFMHSNSHRAYKDTHTHTHTHTHTGTHGHTHKWKRIKKGKTEMRIYEIEGSV